ncbi:hypothetical protein [Photobacterium kagoshimensis]
MLPHPECRRKYAEKSIEKEKVNEASHSDQKSRNQGYCGLEYSITFAVLG